MKPRKPISRLTQPKILRSINRTLLRCLLQRHSNYLESQGIELPPIKVQKRGGYDFKKLAQVLLDEKNRPNELVEVLEGIGMLSDRHGVEVLQRVAKEFGGFEDLNEASIDADFALKAYLDKKEVFDIALSDKRAVDAKCYRCFMLKDEYELNLEHLTEDSIRSLEERFSTWFMGSRRGSGCEIIHSHLDDAQELWFIITHGGTKRRMPTFDNSIKDHTVFRPESGDVVRVRRRGRELWINSTTLSEATEYRKAFGELLCGSEDGYEQMSTYFTLLPLRERRRAALAVDRLEGCPIYNIVLKEMHIMVDKDNNTKSCLKSHGDLFSEIESGKIAFSEGEICSAKFHVYFEECDQPVELKMALPSNASYERDSQSEWIDQWWETQGFIRATPTVPTKYRVESNFEAHYVEQSA